MEGTIQPAVPSTSLHRTLIVVASAYVTMGVGLMSLQGISAGALGRIVVVLGLCLLTSRGANWARMLLGAFVVPISVLLLLRIGAVGSFGWQMWLVSGSVLVALGAYLALFFRRETAAEFGARRLARDRPAPTAT